MVVKDRALGQLRRKRTENYSSECLYAGNKDDRQTVQGKNSYCFFIRHDVTIHLRKVGRHVTSHSSDSIVRLDRLIGGLELRRLNCTAQRRSFYHRDEASGTDNGLLPSSSRSEIVALE